MERNQIKDLMREVFGRNFTMTDLGDWVGMKCPISQWTHEKGRDNTPSAGVSVDPNGMSIFNCFTCKNPRPLSAMLRDYSEYSGDDLGDLLEEVEEGEFLGPRSLPSYEQVKQNRLEEIAMPIEEGLHMDLYDSAVGHPYLRERGISDRTARAMELLFDPEDSEGDARILFPVRGPDGLLFGFSGRAINSDARLKVRDYHGLAKSQCVLGAHLASSHSQIVVVEGLVDTAVLHEVGECGCGVMHSTMTKHQASIIAMVNKPTILMYDGDKAGVGGTATAIKQLSGVVPLFGTTYPEIWIEDDSEDGGHWVKDPGEMLDDEIRSMLAKAYLL